jgi:hypothetical protein
MPRAKISKAELDRQFEASADPIDQLPEHFPPEHTRIPNNLSKAFAAIVKRVNGRLAAGEPVRPVDPEAQQELQSRLRRLRGR